MDKYIAEISLYYGQTPEKTKNPLIYLCAAVAKVTISHTFHAVLLEVG